MAPEEETFVPDREGTQAHEEAARDSEHHDSSSVAENAETHSQEELQLKAAVAEEIKSAEREEIIPQVVTVEHTTKAVSESVSQPETPHKVHVITMPNQRRTFQVIESADGKTFFLKTHDKLLTLASNKSIIIRDAQTKRAMIRVVDHRGIEGMYDPLSGKVVYQEQRLQAAKEVKQPDTAATEHIEELTTTIAQEVNKDSVVRANTTANAALQKEIADRESSYGSEIADQLRQKDYVLFNVSSENADQEDYVFSMVESPTTATISVFADGLPAYVEESGLSKEDIIKQVKEETFTNAELSDRRRMVFAQKLLERAVEPHEADAILKAHYVGIGEAGIGNYEMRHILEKARALAEAEEITKEQRRDLMEAGVTGTAAEHLANVQGMGRLDHLDDIRQDLARIWQTAFGAGEEAIGREQDALMGASTSIMRRVEENLDNRDAREEAQRLMREVNSRMYTLGDTLEALRRAGGAGGGRNQEEQALYYAEMKVSSRGSIPTPERIGFKSIYQLGEERGRPLNPSTYSYELHKRFQKLLDDEEHLGQRYVTGIVDNFNYVGDGGQRITHDGSLGGQRLTVDQAFELARIGLRYRKDADGNLIRVELGYINYDENDIPRWGTTIKILTDENELVTLQYAELKHQQLRWLREKMVEVSRRSNSLEDFRYNPELQDLSRSHGNLLEEIRFNYEMLNTVFTMKVAHKTGGWEAVKKQDAGLFARFIQPAFGENNGMIEAFAEIERRAWMMHHIQLEPPNERNNWQGIWRPRHRGEVLDPNGDIHYKGQGLHGETLRFRTILRKDDIRDAATGNLRPARPGEMIEDPPGSGNFREALIADEADEVEQGRIELAGWATDRDGNIIVGSPYIDPKTGTSFNSDGKRAINPVLMSLTELEVSTNPNYDRIKMNIAKQVAKTFYDRQVEQITRRYEDDTYLRGDAQREAKKQAELYKLRELQQKGWLVDRTSVEVADAVWRIFGRSAYYDVRGMDANWGEWDMFNVINPAILAIYKARGESEQREIMFGAKYERELRNKYLLGTAGGANVRSGGFDYFTMYAITGKGPSLYHYGLRRYLDMNNEHHKWVAKHVDNVMMKLWKGGEHPLIKVPDDREPDPSRWKGKYIPRGEWAGFSQEEVVDRLSDDERRAFDIYDMQPIVAMSDKEALYNLIGDARTYHDFGIGGDWPDFPADFDGCKQFTSIMVDPDEGLIAHPDTAQIGKLAKSMADRKKRWLRRPVLQRAFNYIIEFNASHRKAESKGKLPNWDADDIDWVLTWGNQDNHLEDYMKEDMEIDLIARRLRGPVLPFSRHRRFDVENISTPAWKMKDWQKLWTRWIWIWPAKYKTKTGGFFSLVLWNWLKALFKVAPKGATAPTKV